MYQIGRALRMARAVAGISQAKMAKKVGLSPNYYGKIETNRRIVSNAKLKEVAAYVDMSLEALVLLNMSAPRELRSSDRECFDKVREALVARLVNNVMQGGKLV